MEYILQKGVYEILKEIKSHGKIQPSKLAKIVKSVSEKTLYHRLEELSNIGLLKKEAGFNELGRPVTYYSLTELGKQVLERLEDAEKILKEHAKEKDDEECSFFEEYMRKKGWIKVDEGEID